jgi:hypothetical protein
MKFTVTVKSMVSGNKNIMKCCFHSRAEFIIIIFSYTFSGLSQKVFLEIINQDYIKVYAN